MLPVRTSVRQAAGWVFVHTGAAAVVAVLLAAVPALGWIYLLPVALATADMIIRNVRLISRPTTQNARALFIASNVYLMVVLLAICVASTVNQLR
jgi:heme O synthase-like polyprenyltransferase